MTWEDLEGGLLALMGGSIISMTLVGLWRRWAEPWMLLPPLVVCALGLAVLAAVWGKGEHNRRR